MKTLRIPVSFRTPLSSRSPRRPLVSALKRVVSVIAIFVMAGITLFVEAVPAWASKPTMTSSGSSFASVAMQEWVGQSSVLFGDNINWQVSSSVFGLNDFGQNSIDFALSDIPYSAGQNQSNPNQPYQYLPDVAGGLAFMYNLNGNTGQRISNLNMNAAVIDDIFLGKITRWNDPVIANLNPQLQGDLPSTRIIPVYRTDPSGENYLLSDYLLHQNGAAFTSAQQAWATGGVGRPSAVWPRNVNNNYGPQYPNANNEVAQSGSDNAANYVSAAASNGSITYVETAYAKEHNAPVANLLNASGNNVQPTSVNVATALVKAILHPDLTQDLTNVYTNTEPNAYPLSAYSYVVAPCSPQLAAGQHTTCTGPGASSPFPSAKGNELGQFAAFMACGGQARMANLGYSPLPPNLVQEDFDAIGRMNGGVQPPPPTPSTCQNPYVDGQTVLPGEPCVPGQSNCGVISNQQVVAQAAAGDNGGSGSSGGSSASGGSSGSGGSGSSGSGGGSVTIGGITLTAAQKAKGFTVVNGQLVRLLGAPGTPNQYERANQLTASVSSLGLGWSWLQFSLAILALLLIFGPSIYLMSREGKTKGASKS